MNDLFVMFTFSFQQISRTSKEDSVRISKLLIVEHATAKPKKNDLLKLPFQLHLTIRHQPVKQRRPLHSNPIDPSIYTGPYNYDGSVGPTINVLCLAQIIGNP